MLNSTLNTGLFPFQIPQLSDLANQIQTLVTMAIQLSRTDPATLAQFSQAYGRIVEATAVLSEDIVRVTINWHPSQQAFQAGGTPFMTEVVDLTDGEIAQFKDQYVNSIYQILLNRPAYAGATSV